MEAFIIFFPNSGKNLTKEIVFKSQISLIVLMKIQLLLLLRSKSVFFNVGSMAANLRFVWECFFRNREINSFSDVILILNKVFKRQHFISWHFQLDLATAPQVHLFLSRVIKLLINATLSLPNPASHATFFLE